MSIYSVAICIILIFGLIVKNNKSEVCFVNNYRGNITSNMYLILIAVILILISGLRDYTIGLDTLRYYNSFSSSSKGTLTSMMESRIEIGYLLLTKVVSTYFNFTFFLLLVSTMLISSVFVFVKKYSPYVALSCLFFVCFGFYYLTFNELRQAIAASIAIWAIVYIKKQNLLKFTLVIFLASLFHQTAFILLPTYFIGRFSKISFQHLIIIGVSLLISFAYVPIIFSYLNSFLAIMYESNEETGGWGLFMFQIFTLLLAYINRKKDNENRIYLILFYLLAFNIIIFPICHQTPTMFRLGHFLWIYCVVFIPIILNRIPNNIIKIGMMCLYIVVALISFNAQFTSFNQLIPYLFLGEA